MVDSKTWVPTYSGRKINLASPDPREIKVFDIAHHLSQVSRFTGCCVYRYSVAQHSVLVSHLVPEQHALEALFHDGHEAFTNDLTTPLKRLMKELGFDFNMQVERPLSDAVMRAVGVHSMNESAIYQLSERIKRADALALLAERDFLLPRSLREDERHSWGFVWSDFTNVEKVRVKELVSGFACEMSWKVARQFFMDRFSDLVNSDNDRLIGKRAVNQ